MSLSETERTQADQVWSSLAQRLEVGELTLTLSAGQARLLLAQIDALREQLAAKDAQLAEAQRELENTNFGMYEVNQKLAEAIRTLEALDTALAARLRAERPTPEPTPDADELRDLAESFHREGELHKAKLLDAAALALAEKAATPEPTLREALDTYGQHLPNCGVSLNCCQVCGLTQQHVSHSPCRDVRDGHAFVPLRCNCGLEAALASVSPPPQEGREP